MPAGRRSGKTELAKRHGVRLALRCRHDNGRFIYGAPTFQQAKRIYWQDIKALVPAAAISSVSESELTIRLVNNATLIVTGLDKPERIEGDPIDWIGLDEFGNMKASAWENHVRPALSTRGRLGSAWLYGVPEGRNHYYDLAMKAKADQSGAWAFHTWKSAEILPPEEIQAARDELDEVTFAQEYEASFVNYAGRAYYGFNLVRHASAEAVYRPDLPLTVCLDFNIAPGTASVLQEVPTHRAGFAPTVTNAIGEVWIPRSSNTVRVCEKIAEDWKHHAGEVRIYGDATGAAGGSAKVDGSDWELVKRTLEPAFPGRLRFRVPTENPRERVRVNAVNSRLESANGRIGFQVHPAACRNIIKDLEGVVLIQGGTGQIDKDADPRLTHLSDGIGYYIAAEFPLTGRYTTTTAF